MKTPLEHLLIRASAGTGKTFQLSNRYISLLASGVSPTNILATTFTRKAAGEIRDRILERLADAILDEKASEDLLSHILVPTAAEQLDFKTCFQAMVTDLNRLNIGTLDSFFSVWTTKLSLEFGLTPGWSILNTTEYDNLMYTAISDVVQYGKNADLSRLLILLNKGSVSRSITSNIHDSIQNLRSLYQQSSEDVWNQRLATGRLKPQYLDDALNNLEAAVNNIDQPALTKGVLADLDMLRAQDFTAAIDKGVLKKIIEHATTYNRVEIPDKLISLYQPVLEYLGNHFSHEVHNQALATYDLLNRFTATFNNLKRQAGRLEFSDATDYAARISELPGELLIRLNSDISHLLLDEFQDTSLAQWRAISHLVTDVTTTAGSPVQSLFCVGDTKQAIYGWRGGRREIFDTLTNYVPQIRSDELKDSYRSSTFVLQFINKVFQNLSNHPRLGELTPVLKQWSDDFEEHSAARNLDGYVLYKNSPSASKLKDRLQNSLNETVELVKQLLATDKNISIGVLLRKNDDIGQLIQMLASEGIIASEEGGNTLTRFCPIQLIRNWLHLLEFPNDSLALFQIRQSPLKDRLNTGDAEACLSSPTFLYERQRLLQLGAGDYIDELSQLMRPYLTNSQQFRLQQLIRHADSFDSDEPLRLTELLQSMDSERFTEESSSIVRVMTIHASKGLEFDAVVLPDLEPALTRTPDIIVARDDEQLPASIFPYRNAKIQSILPQHYRDAVLETRTEKLQEVLCVLYVAMTRAAHALYLIGPSQPKTPSDVPVTLAGLIQMALNDSYNCEPEAILYQEGNPCWYNDKDNTAELTDNRPQLPDGLNRHVINENQLLPTASPSSLEGGDHFHASGLLQIPNHNALNFGTLVHQVFEGITWWNDTQIEQYLDHLTKRRISWDESLRSTLTNLCAHKDITSVLSEEFYSKLDSFAGSEHLVVKMELPVTSIVEGQLIRGFADRLVIGLKGGQIVAADIVDFKTDDLGPDNSLLKERVQHYQPQLAAYQATIAQMFKIDVSQVSARLLFITAGVHAVLENVS